MKPVFDPEKLVVVADFDATLTKYYVNGERLSSVYTMISHSGLMSDEYMKTSHEDFEKYYPLETDPNISHNERFELMNEWWNSQLGSLVKFGMSQSIIRKIVNKYHDTFRPFALETLKLLAEHNIPVIIISAGLGDFIKAFLEKEHSLYDNITIISNFFKFDEAGIAIDYQGGLVHGMNKNDHDIGIHKSQVLLLGDMIGDAHMVDERKHELVHKIAFVNKPEYKESLEKFFDELIEEESMERVYSYLKSLF